MKFHIGTNGTPSKCTARKRSCPFGGIENHFNSIAEAQRAADIRNAELHGMFGSKSKQVEVEKDYTGTGSFYFKVTSKIKGIYCRKLGDGTIVHPVDFVQRIFSDPGRKIYGFNELIDDLDVSKFEVSFDSTGLTIDKPIDGDPKGYCGDFDARQEFLVYPDCKRATTREILLYNTICSNPEFTEDLIFKISMGDNEIYSKGIITEPEIIEKYMDNEELGPQ